MAIDIDNLKVLNDQFGHLFGDNVIRSISAVCKEMLRETDCIGRYGGDEFAVVMKGAALECGKDKAMSIAKAIRKLQIQNNEVKVPVSVSIGISENQNGQLSTFEELFHKADVALYSSKGDGKDRVSVYSGTLECADAN